MIANVEQIQLALDSIRIDGGTQSRSELSADKIEAYAHLMIGGTVFPPIIVFYDGSAYWLGDGFHRYHAEMQIGSNHIDAEIKQGTRRDAVLYSMEANTRHGIPLPLADRKRCAKALLEDEEWSMWSDREIGRRCGLSHDTVGAIRKEIYGDYRQRAINQPVEPVEEVEEVRNFRITNEGKRKTVEESYPSLESMDGVSNRDIARECGVDEGTIRNYKKKLLDMRQSETPIVEEEIPAKGTLFELLPHDEPLQETKVEPVQIDPIEVAISQPEEVIPTSEEMDLLEIEDVESEVDAPEPIIEVAPAIYKIQHPQELRQETIPAKHFLEEIMPGFTEWQQEYQPQVTLQDRTEQGEEEPDTAKEERDAHVMDVMGSSDSPEWYTPISIINYTLRLFGEIDLDPCSNSHETPNVLTKTRYTKEDDGLAQTWKGKVYLNPPYGSEIGKWINKLVTSYEEGEVAESISLLPARIDTIWFQPLYAYLMCNVRGRIQFANSPYSAPFPCVVVYMGNRPDMFIDIFKTLGPIMRRVG